MVSCRKAEGIIDVWGLLKYHKESHPRKVFVSFSDKDSF